MTEPPRHDEQPAPADEPTPSRTEPIAPPSAGPPGGRTFSLEGRRAPALYLVGWVLSVGGFFIAFLVGPQASDTSVRTILILLGAVVVAVGLAAGAGSQVLERQDRHPDRYRGPSPALVFGIYFFAISALGVALVGSGLGAADSPSSFLVIGTAQALGYVVVVWLFAVRTGALTWADMGWPTWHGSGLRSALRAIGRAFAVMLPTTFAVVILGGFLGQLLDVEAPNVIPTAGSSMEALAVVLAAAVLVPLGEEVFFRGLSVTAWLRDLGERSALLRSATFFALIHIVNIQVVDDAGSGLAQAVLTVAIIGPVGLALGWIFIRVGLLGAIAGHAAYNGSLLALLALQSELLPPT